MHTTGYVADKNSDCYDESCSALERSGAMNGRRRKRRSGRSRSEQQAESAAHSPLQPNISLIS